MSKNNFLQAICVLLVFLTISQLVMCRPSDTPAKQHTNDDDENIDPNDYHGNLSIEVIKQIRQCDRDPDTKELCMRCAKETKAVEVYPLCCANEDKVKDWCEAYIYYGVQ